MRGCRGTLGAGVSKGDKRTGRTLEAPQFSCGMMTGFDANGGTFKFENGKRSLVRIHELPGWHGSILQDQQTAK